MKTTYLMAHILTPSREIAFPATDAAAAEQNARGFRVVRDLDPYSMEDVQIAIRLQATYYVGVIHNDGGPVGDYLGTNDDPTYLAAFECDAQRFGLWQAGEKVAALKADPRPEVSRRGWRVIRAGSI